MEFVSMLHPLTVWLNHTDMLIHAKTDFLLLITEQNLLLSSWIYGFLHK